MMKYLKGLLKGIIVMLMICIVWILFHQIISVYDQQNTPPIGTMVTVDDKEMHVYQSGEGANTIVLMSGLGTPAPTLDFAPLIEELSTQNKVVIAESFGYGWSDLTDKERSVENIVEELRCALKESGQKPPYILAPHSLSGVYATYYVNKYPEEVSGIITMDCMLPTQIEYFGGESFGQIPSIARLATKVGLSRIITYISPSTLLANSSCYTKENMEMQKKISAWNAYNETIIKETNTIDANIAKTNAMSFPKDMPILFLTKSDKTREVRSDGKTSVSFYSTYITNPSCQKVVEIDAPHYLHWTASEEVGRLINDFINTHL